MSLQMYMKIAGVTGEANEYKHKGWSEILSWNWGMTSNSKTSNAGPERRTSMNEISVIKPIGIDSTSIRNLYALGEVISNINLNISYVTSKREGQKNYVSIIMEDVIIKSIVTGGGVEDNYFKEHITLSFDRVTFECNKPISNGDDSGNDKASMENDFRWNVIENIKWVKE